MKILIVYEGKTDEENIKLLNPKWEEGIIVYSFIWRSQTYDELQEFLQKKSFDVFIFSASLREMAISLSNYGHSLGDPIPDVRIICLGSSPPGDVIYSSWEDLVEDV